MGIHGLTTFIQRYHDKYKEKVYLHDCPVVIDGCNLMFFLYFDWRQSLPSSTPTKKRSSSSNSGSPLSKPSPLKHPHLFGGDYQIYAQNVRDFFQHLKLCGIISIVLFDGAYDALKIKTAFKRFADNLKQNVRQQSNGNNNLQGITPGFSYSPVFMKAVFVEVLQEQKILHYQTEQEADCTIAFIARKLGNCPILSSDSDFHIYINAVVLPLHTLRFKKVAPLKDKNKTKNSDDTAETDTVTKVWRLHSQFVSLSNLCRKEFKLRDSRLLPLAAVILGNDWIKTSTFSHFHSTTGGGSRVKRNSRIAYLLKWLGKQKSYPRVVQAMLATVRESNREKTADLVNEIVSIYEGCGGEERVWNMLVATGQINKYIKIDDDSSAEVLEIDEMLDNICLNDSTTQDTAADDDEEDILDEEEEEESDDTEEITISCENNTTNKKLPDWYLDSHINCSFPTYILKLVRNQMIFLSPQAEVSSLPSTHNNSIPIMQVMAGLLLGPNTTLTLVSRHKARITDIKLEPTTELKDFGTLPLVSENCTEFKKTFSQDQRAQIIFETLGLYSTDFVEFINEWPVSLRIWVISLVYFINCAEKEVLNLNLEDDINNNGLIAVHATSLPIAVSILISIIKNIVLNPSGAASSKKNNSDDNNTVQSRTISDLLNQTDPSVISKLKIFYGKFENVSDLSSRTFMKTYDITRTYNICRFTCILFHLYQLNRILGDPFKAPRINHSLNNWFTYNLAEKLSLDMKNCDFNNIGQVVEELCGVNDMSLVVEKVLKYAL